MDQMQAMSWNNMSDICKIRLMSILLHEPFLIHGHWRTNLHVLKMKRGQMAPPPFRSPKSLPLRHLHMLFAPRDISALISTHWEPSLWATLLFFLNPMG